MLACPLQGFASSQILRQPQGQPSDLGEHSAPAIHACLLPPDPSAANRERLIASATSPPHPPRPLRSPLSPKVPLALPVSPSLPAPAPGLDPPSLAVPPAPAPAPPFPLPFPRAMASGRDQHRNGSPEDESASELV
eukprot:764636-Hanusia_phi.AAC.3